MKLQQAWAANGFPASFRVHPNAAPLKPSVNTQLAAAAKAVFPRSSERGPIEAFSASPRPSCLRAFRVHPNAAPLKPFGAAGLPVSFGRFPRSSERGPIEADYRVPPPDQADAFRVHPNAAPLKPDELEDGEDAVIFPRSSERGPIEAGPLPALQRRL